MRILWSVSSLTSRNMRFLRVFPRKGHYKGAPSVVKKTRRFASRMRQRQTPDRRPRIAPVNAGALCYPARGGQRAESSEPTRHCCNPACVPRMAGSVDARCGGLSGEVCMPSSRREFLKATGVALGASYADIRVNRYRTESVFTREKQVQQVTRGQNFGCGVRVLVKGTWGFAASRKVTPEDVGRVTRQAIEIAQANAAYQRKRVELAPAVRAAANWRSSFEKDPFEVPLEEKIAFLLKLNETALKVKGVSFVNSSLAFVNEQKFYASSEGSRIEHYIIRSFPQFSMTAVDSAKGDFQTRRSLAGPQGMGYEYLEKHPWLAEAEQAASEAVEKLKAKPVEPGKYDLVFHPTHLWLTIHESTGHSTVLDRALGWEADYAGTSFLTPDKLGKFQFGSKRVNIVADRTQPAGLATVGYDDDGVAAQRGHLVKDGVFVDWQTTRELAPLVGQKTSY